MKTVDLTTKIKPDRQVRIRAGATVTSTNPKREQVVVKRPYWIKVEAIEGDEITWRGSANYPCRTTLSNVDAVEDLS